jgi:hypothetical protein
MTAITARPARPVDVVALQYGRPNRMVGVPLYILGAVVVITVLISVAVLRADGHLDRTNGNGSILWSVLGYTVAIGVQNVATSFPFALALGSTRRTFVLGNLLTAAAQSVLVAAAAAVLLGLETVSGGWFVDAHVLDVDGLGGGNPLLLAASMFLGVLLALSVGGLFGAAWIRFGARGPVLLSLGIAVVLVALLLIGAGVSVAVVAAAAQPWWPVASAVVVVALALVGQYLFLRRASVR